MRPLTISSCPMWVRMISMTKVEMTKPINWWEKNWRIKIVSLVIRIWAIVKVMKIKMMLISLEVVEVLRQSIILITPFLLLNKKMIKLWANKLPTLTMIRLWLKQWLICPDLWTLLTRRTAPSHHHLTNLKRKAKLSSFLISSKCKFLSIKNKNKFSTQVFQSSKKMLCKSTTKTRALRKRMKLYSPQDWPMTGKWLRFKTTPVQGQWLLTLTCALKLKSKLTALLAHQLLVFKRKIWSQGCKTQRLRWLLQSKTGTLRQK